MKRHFSIVLVGLVLSIAASAASADKPAIAFSFDKVTSTPTEKNREGETIEVIHETTAEGKKDGTFKIGGYHDLVQGVYGGKALMFDGYTTRIAVPADHAPDVSKGLTVQAWVALGAYPWNWVPIAAQEKTVSKNEQKKDTSWPQTIVADEKQAGWYFGIGPRGQLALMFAVDGKWHQCISEDFVFPLQKWVHVGATYDPQSGVTLYGNGSKIKTMEITGEIDPADVELMIGMNRQQRKQSHPVRPFATLPTWFALDGIIDDLKIFSVANADIGNAIVRMPTRKPEFEPRVMPSGPDGDVPFGAYYHHLKYYKQWDRLWRVDDHPDVVVRFEDSPVKVVFWRGTRFGPAWVTENGLWMGDQSIENFNGEAGCFEHMLDGRCEMSHVRIIESTPARAVVHWRYKPIASNGDASQVDPKTGWADWVDEYYYFYPDRIGMRHVVLRTQGRYLWPEEVIGLCHPGQRPEDVVDLSALTLANLKGDEHTYTWAERSPRFCAKKRNKNYIHFGGEPDSPDDTDYEDALEDKPVLLMINTKSKLKPFQVVEPEAWMAVFGIEHRPGVSHFPWWNHWPVSPLPSDGRYAQAPDRAAHFSLAWASPVPHQGEGETFWWAWMYGITDQPLKSKIPLAASWLHAPKLTVTGDGYANGEYNFQERCYYVTCNKNDTPATLKMTFAASQQAPVHNLPIVIENWGRRRARIKLNGETLNWRDRKYRAGLSTQLDKTNLVLFIETQSTEPVTVELEPMTRR